MTSSKVTLVRNRTIDHDYDDRFRQFGIGAGGWGWGVVMGIYLATHLGIYNRQKVTNLFPDDGHDRSQKLITKKKILILLWFNLHHIIEGPCVTCRRKHFLRHTTDSNVGHSGGNERHLVGTDLDLVPACKAFVRSGVVLFLALYRVY